MSTPLGKFTKNADLLALERDLVAGAWQGAERAFCFQSHFPVGAAICAVNDAGESRVFIGCNVENDTFPATICAERNAAMQAIANGFKRFTHVAVVCKNYPGGSPCGLCRQVLRQFGCDAILLNVCDKDSNALRATVGDLLPDPMGQREAYSSLSLSDRLLVDRAIKMAGLAHAPYSKKTRGAVACGVSANGKRRRFAGTQCENASYGGTISAERAAMVSAVSAGFKSINTLAIVGDVKMDGEDLQVLREFGGLTAQIVFVAPDKSIVRATVDELLPDSFGPDALAK